MFAQKSKDLQPLVSEWIDHQIPARSLAEVTDLQTAIVFMASPASNYMVSVCIEGVPRFVCTHISNLTEWSVSFRSKMQLAAADSF